MINCEKWNVSWQGPKIIVRAELCTLMHALIKANFFTPEDIEECVAEAKKTDEETDADIEKLESEISPELVALARLAANILAES